MEKDEYREYMVKQLHTPGAWYEVQSYHSHIACPICGACLPNSEGAKNIHITWHEVNNA